MISQETLLHKLHLLRTNNEIYCDANLMLTSDLKVANHRLKCLTSGDEKFNDLLGIGKLARDLYDAGSFEASSSSVCTYTDTVENSLHMTSMAKSSLKEKICSHMSSMW